MAAFMMSIRGVCKVPDDLKNEKWPELFTCRPEVGDIVRSLERTELKVAGIKHAHGEYEDDGKTRQQAYIVVVLERP